MPRRGLAYGRVALLVAGLAIGVWVFFLSAHLAGAGSEAATRLIVSVLATLNGFVIAVITVSGNPLFLYPGSWRIADAHRREIMRSLLRYRILFYACLVSVVSAIVTAAVTGVEGAEAVAYWSKRATLGVSACAIVWSFGLPTALVRAQGEKLEAEVERRRQQNRDTQS